MHHFCTTPKNMFYNILLAPLEKPFCALDEVLRHPLAPEKHPILCYKTYFRGISTTFGLKNGMSGTARHTRVLVTRYACSTLKGITSITSNSAHTIDSLFRECLDLPSLSRTCVACPTCNALWVLLVGQVWRARMAWRYTLSTERV